MNRQENKTKQRHSLDPLLQESQDEHDVRNDDARHGEGHTNVQDGRIGLYCDDIVALGLDIPLLCESWNFKEDGKGNDGARDDWNPPIVGDKTVQVNKVGIGRPDIFLELFPGRGGRLR